MKQSSQDYHRIADAITFIRNQFPAHPSLKSIADHVHLSEFHFQRLFSRWAGVSPKKFIQYIRIEYAKQQLAQGDSLLDTAYATGLSSTGRLHDLFVSIEGVTPGQYKSGGVDLEIIYGIHNSPFGQFLIALTERGICKLSFTEDISTAIEELRQSWSHAKLTLDHTKTSKAAEQVFNMDAQQVSLFVKGTPFQLKVWEALLKIAEGDVCTYGDIARQIGQPGASRAVGTAIGQNPVAFLIPCHRVIRKTGEIGNYRWGTTRKTAMLGWEASRMQVIR